MASGESLRNEYAHFLVMNDRDLLRQTLGALNIDVAAVACVQRSEEGSRVFSEQITAIEG